MILYYTVMGKEARVKDLASNYFLILLLSVDHTYIDWVIVIGLLESNGQHWLTYTGINFFLSLILPKVDISNLYQFSYSYLILIIKDEIKM